MTENNIIEGLEALMNIIKLSDEKYICTSTEMLAGALNCIYNLKAEKEALIAGQESLQKFLVSKEAEIKGLKNACFCIANERDAIGDCLNIAVEEAKAEAIKEFAEKVKELILDKYVPLVELDILTPNDIDNLVKEMVGDAE